MTKLRGDANYFFVRGTIFCLYVVSSVYLSLRVRNCVYYCVDKHKLAQVIAECFVGMTLPISAFHAWEHLTNFVRPRLQSQIVRIIWMVPIYSFESLLSIVYMEYTVYFQAIREIYEAYVIYCFMRFLLHFLGDGRNLADRLASMPASMGYHKPPFCCLQPWQMGADFLRRCKAGVFQYVVVRLLLAVLTLFLSIIGFYEEGKYEYTSAYLWITGICCCSQSWALYSLFMFYHCSHKELITMRPFMKFLCLKMVIFFCWWQALAISILVRLGHINSAHGHSVQEVADLIQDLLISMEMLVAAIAFLNSFPITEFATVRQLSWGKGNPTSLSPPPAGHSTGTTGLSPYSGGTTNFALKSGPKNGVAGFPSPAGGGSLVETVACITGSLINHAGIINQRSTQSPPCNVLGDKTSLSVSGTSLDSSDSSPLTDDRKSPTTSSSRKVFLPYAVPSRKMDIDKKVKMSKKDKIDLLSKKYSVENDKDEEIESKEKSKLRSENVLGLNFSSPLTILRDAGLFKYPYQSILPLYSFSFSSDNINQKRIKKVEGDDVYNSLVTEKKGSGVLNRSENNRVNASMREGGIREGVCKGTDIDNDSKLSLLSHFSSNSMSMGTLIDTSNSDINSRMVNIRDSDGALVSVVFTGAKDEYDRDLDRRRLKSRGREEVAGEKSVRKEKMIRDADRDNNSRLHADLDSTTTAINGFGRGRGQMVSLSTSSTLQSPIPLPMARRRSSSTNAYLDIAGVTIDDTTASFNNKDIRIRNESNMIKSSPSTKDVDGRFPSKSNNRNISPTMESAPSKSLSPSPFSQKNSLPLPLPLPLSLSTSAERIVSTDDSGMMKSRNSSENIGWISHATISSSSEEEEGGEGDVGDRLLGAKCNGNYQDSRPLFNAEYPHPSSNIFLGSQNRYQRSASPAANVTTGQINFNVSNFNGSNKDLYSNNDLGRSDILQPHFYSTASHNNNRVQLFGKNPDGLPDYTMNSLHDNSKDYLNQFVFKDKDRFLGSNGVSTGIDNFNSGSSSDSGGIGSSLMLCQQSPLQALVTCTVPRELQEDLQELGVYIAEKYVHAPYISLRRFVKGNAARS